MLLLLVTNEPIMQSQESLFLSLIIIRLYCVSPFAIKFSAIEN